MSSSWKIITEELLQIKGNRKDMVAKYSIVRIQRKSDNAFICCPKGEEVKSGTEQVFEEKMVEIIPVLMKAIILRNPINSTYSK